MKFIIRCFAYVVFSLAGIAGLSVVFVLLVLYFLGADLPDHNELKKYSPNLASRVFLQDGTKLCEYSEEKRYFIPIDRVPKRLKNAFVAVEDKHFYEHAGVDVFGIVRSVVTNISNIGTGKRPQGASTITQQVAKLFLLKSSELSYVRKLKEAIISFRIEAALTKDQILELYINQLYMGFGAYGVAAAAKVYFNKTVDELTIAQCAYLASLAKGANNYHPIRHKQRAVNRRNASISRMLEDGYITKEEYTSAIKEDLVTVDSQGDINADYYAEEIRKALITKLPIESLNKEGLIIRGTLDAKLQKYAYNALRKGLIKVDRGFGWRGAIGNIDVHQSHKSIIQTLRKMEIKKGEEEFLKAAVLLSNGKSVLVLTENGDVSNIVDEDFAWTRGKIKDGDVIFVIKITEGVNKGKFLVKQCPQVQGAIVVVEVDTGRILAMQGGYSFAQSEFNRVTQAMRQPGSVFKPFVYLAALDNGFAPNSIIDATPVEINLGSLGIWKPKNHLDKIIDKITLRRALERSINTATVRIMQEVGIEKIAKVAEDFGIYAQMPHMFSYVLGAGEATPLVITMAYAMIANGGKRIKPRLIDYIQDKYGNTLVKFDEQIPQDCAYDAKLPPFLNDNRQQIADVRSVYQLTSLLEGVVLRGSAVLAQSLNYQVAGKTGTSNDSKDVWFVGYTTDIAVGVFVGFDDQSKSLGKNAIGTTIALPIFVDFMENAKHMFPAKPFSVPKGIKLRKIDLESGGAPSEYSTSIVEAFKDEDEDVVTHDSNIEIRPHLSFENNTDILDGDKSDDNQKTNDDTKVLMPNAIIY